MKMENSSNSLFFNISHDSRSQFEQLYIAEEEHTKFRNGYQAERHSLSKGTRFFCDSFIHESFCV